MYQRTKAAVLMPWCSCYKGVVTLMFIITDYCPSFPIVARDYKPIGTNDWADC